MRGYPMLVGQVPFAASCKTCHTFDSYAGTYWQDKPPTQREVDTIQATYECKECARIRKIVREELKEAS